MPENIFEEEWRDCLDAHYMHVIRTKDKVTEPSLTVVMHQAGYNDSELAELRVRATMHVDDSGEDFVPDLDALETEARVIAVAKPDENLPVAAIEEAPPVMEVPTEALIEEIEEAADEMEQLDEAPPAEAIPEEPDAPQQLSLF
jgi:hypothetical protein